MGGKESSSKNGERTFNPFSMRSSSIQFLKGKKKKEKTGSSHFRKMFLLIFIGADFKRRAPTTRQLKR